MNNQHMILLSFSNQQDRLNKLNIGSLLFKIEMFQIVRFGFELNGGYRQNLNLYQLTLKLNIKTKQNSDYIIRILINIYNRKRLFLIKYINRVNNVKYNGKIRLRKLNKTIKRVKIIFS